jgi:hypothetical protein
MAAQLLMYVASAPGNNLVSLYVPKNGKIVEVLWNVNIAVSGADFNLQAELAFAPTLMSQTNGVDNVISIFNNSADLTTSGVASVGFSMADPCGDGISVNQGERIYLNSVGTAISANYACLVRFNFTIGR